jgi:hypothetical protein
VWFLIVAGGEPKQIEMLAIDQRTLHWDAPDNIPVAELIQCVSEIEVDASSTPPKVVAFH